MKHVIFDFGGVLITFDPLNFLNRLFQDEAKAKRCCDLFMQSREWQQMDRGVLSVDEGKRIFKETEPVLEAEIELFFSRWYDMFQPMEASVSLLERLHQNNIPLYAISNFMKEPYEDLSPRFSFMSLFREIVLSYRINHVKPEREIYEYLLNKHQLNPADCVFIDDMERNILGARAVGMQAIHFQSPQQLTQELKSMKVLSI